METIEAQLLLAGRNHGPSILNDWIRTALPTPTVLRGLLARVWSAAEFPERGLERRRWVSLFQTAHYPATTSGPVTLWRGSTSGRKKGLAWSTDRDQAMWFANRSILFDHGHLWRLNLVESDDILCDIDAYDVGGRGEDEMIVNPSIMHKIVRVDL